MLSLSNLYPEKFTYLQENNFYVFYRLIWLPVLIAAPSQLSAKSGHRSKNFRAKSSSSPLPPTKASGGLQQKWQQRQGPRALHYRECTFIAKERLPGDPPAQINHKLPKMDCSKSLQRWEFLGLSHTPKFFVHLFTQCKPFPFVHPFMEIKSKPFTFVSQ